MHAINKWTLAQFECDSYSQCRLKDGSTNEHLEEPRAIELFLKDIEPRYNNTLKLIRKREIDREAVYTIAGLISYIEGCSPAGVRIAKSIVEKSIEALGSLIAAKNINPESPHLAQLDLTDDALRVIKAQVGHKYAHSFGITKLIERLHLLANSQWDFIFSKPSDSTFFTSDFPVAIEASDDEPRFNDRIFPLAPDIAVRIRINIDYDYDGIKNFNFFRYNFMEAQKQEIYSFNKSIVMCAENTLYYRDDDPWVLPFVDKNRFFRIAAILQHMPIGARDFLTTKIQVCAYAPDL
ncbi:DUF4238 domain-containing protein [Pararhizobium gei]|uniref:DUF4238 domain-containing protein n=1 Tax=Pararhizobium gei TaxID=1395951 RepID=UPI0023DB1744|nr:DUF4238 domain-containing protein [Rhizobium gei]